MGEGFPDPPDLNSIRAPDSSVPDTPDEATSREIADEAASKLKSPGWRLEDQHQRELKRAYTECEQRSREIGELRNRFESMKDEHHLKIVNLTSENARLDEALANALAVNTLSSILVGFRGLLFSIASFLQKYLYKIPILLLGIGLLVGGFLLEATAVWRSRAFRSGGIQGANRQCH